jgi:hypothetical protein
MMLALHTISVLITRLNAVAINAAIPGFLQPAIAGEANHWWSGLSTKAAALHGLSINIWGQASPGSYQVDTVPMPRAKPKSHERLIVALDLPSGRAARELVECLGEAVVFYKVGLELFMSGDGFAVVDWLVEQNKQVFVDLKFFDVPATVARAVSRLRDRDVAFATVHGNDAMMRAAAEASGEVGILAVTVLTSLDRGDLEDLGFLASLRR